MVLLGGGKALATETSEDVSMVKGTSSNNFAKSSEASASQTDDSQSGITITPGTSTFAKAPVEVTFKVPEDAIFVMYSTNEPGVPNQRYTGPFQVTKSGTLVKATAFTQTGQFDAEATYSIVPDQPIFSKESTTFSGAFDVTLTLPTTTDATSTIHYAIGEKATAESPVYKGPIEISASNVGEEVVLHAVVVDEYGNVGEEKTCTYTYDKPASLTFKAQDADGSYYATFSADRDVVFPTDATVYAVSVKEGKTVMTALSTGSYDVYNGSDDAVEGYYVPANTGVLVMNNGNETPYYFVKKQQAVTLPANQLKASVKGGVFEAEEVYKYYKLAYNDYSAKTGLGFYWGADSGGAFKVKAGTAYLAVPITEVQNAKGYAFAFDSEVTGVNQLSVKSNQSKAIYNVNGQRVDNMQQTGLYIVNGKKVVIRK